MNKIEETLNKVENLINLKDISFDYGFALSNENYFTRKRYTGIFNNLILMIVQNEKKYKFPYWIGFHQANKLHLGVKKGEPGTPIISKQYKNTYYDENGNILDESEKDKADSFKENSFYRDVYVWNIEQTDIDIEAVNAFSYSEDLSGISEALSKYTEKEGIQIIKSDTGYCYYSKKQDHIGMVDMLIFYDKLAYYEALAHESFHSTGHEKRLNRNLQTKDKKTYSEEEIIAEFATMMFLSEFNLARRDKDMASYIKGYLHGANIRDMFHLCLKYQQAIDYVKGKKDA